MFLSLKFLNFKNKITISCEIVKNYSYFEQWRFFSMIVHFNLNTWVMIENLERLWNTIEKSAYCSLTVLIPNFTLFWPHFWRISIYFSIKRNIPWTVYSTVHISYIIISFSYFLCNHTYFLTVYSTVIFFLFSALFLLRKK